MTEKLSHLEIRKKFFDFFSVQKHHICPPSQLVSDKDLSVLFTTAGMQQFKQNYLNPARNSFRRAVTVQPCLRTSDIDEVGDSTHHTFFEMLGNFSFNDYHKKEAIKYAWEFLTEVLGIDPSRISATYFGGNNKIKADEESKSILKKYTQKGLKKIEKRGFADNFWSLKAEGSPGGPTVEFYIDGVEVWNLVFNEYIFKNKKFIPTSIKGVDTGMGLERLAVILQGKKDNYQTDLFKSLMDTVKINIKDLRKARVVADHIKASCFIISEGVEPSNKEHGYILRRFLRRIYTVLFLNGIGEKVLPEYVGEVIGVYKDVYPKISEQTAYINQTIAVEQQKFSQTLKKGLKEFNKAIANKKFGPKTVFKLYDTYGFPFELTYELASEKEIVVDKKAVKNLFREHQKKSRTGSKKKFKGGLAQINEATTKLHTAHHLLLGVLRELLGEDIAQKGSNINSERLRIDFNYPSKIDPKMLKKIEKKVQEAIDAGLEVKSELMETDRAFSQGALGEFNAKYGDKVTVYSIIDPNTGKIWSKEICGGPHVENTKNMGRFKIAKEESSGSGVRRIKARLIE